MPLAASEKCPDAEQGEAERCVHRNQRHPIIGGQCGGAPSVAEQLTTPITAAGTDNSQTAGRKRGRSNTGSASPMVASASALGHGMPPGVAWYACAVSRNNSSSTPRRSSKTYWTSAGGRRSAAAIRPAVRVRQRSPCRRKKTARCSYSAAWLRTLPRRRLQAAWSRRRHRPK